MFTTKCGPTTNNKSLPKSKNLHGEAGFSTSLNSTWPPMESSKTYSPQLKNSSMNSKLNLRKPTINSTVVLMSIIKKLLDSNKRLTKLLEMSSTLTIYSITSLSPPDKDLKELLNNWLRTLLKTENSSKKKPSKENTNMKPSKPELMNTTKPSLPLMNA